MPFGLKNPWAIYQRAMVSLFHDTIHKEIEVYIDDMIVKSQSEEDEGMGCVLGQHVHPVPGMSTACSRNATHYVLNRA